MKATELEAQINDAYRKVFPSRDCLVSGVRHVGHGKFRAALRGYWDDNGRSSITGEVYGTPGEILEAVRDYS